MKKLFLALLFLVFSSLPCYALESRFLEDISGVFAIKPGSIGQTDDKLILNNCSVEAQGLGEGSIGQLQITNESPGKVGELSLQNIRFPGINIQQVILENVRGNFAALAPALPLLFHLQQSALTNSKRLPQELGLIKAFIPALRTLHIDKLAMSGVGTVDHGFELEFKSIVYNDVTFSSIGQGLIQDVKGRRKGQLVFTLSEANWDTIVFRSLENLLNGDIYKLNPESINPSDLETFFNLTIKNYIMDNLRIPMIGVTLDSCKFTIDSQPERLNLNMGLQNLRVPGFFLAMAGLENTPEIASFDAKLRLKAEYDDESYASIQKFEFKADDLFLFNGRGGIEGTMQAKGDDFTMKDVELNFQNLGIINCLSQEEKNQLRVLIISTLPFLSSALDKMLNGNASSISLSFEDLNKLETLNIEVK